MINPLKVYVSNTLAANTGTTIPTAVNDDVLLLDRALVALSADTIANGVANDLIYVALGTSATAGTDVKSVAIPTKGIRKVSVATVALAVQHKVTLNAAAVPATSAAGTSFSVKVFYHDTNRVMQDKQMAQFFTYKTLAANETASTIYTALAAKINAVATFSKQITATVNGSTLDLVGLAVADNAFGLPQFRYFDVALRSGFDTTVATPITVTAGIPGKGLGNLVKQQELAGIYDFNRTQFPQTTDPRRAVVGGYYNLVTIQYETTNTSAFNRLASNLQTLVVAFKAAVTDGVTPYAGTGTAIHSTKGQAFIDTLEALTEGSFVAFVE